MHFDVVVVRVRVVVAVASARRVHHSLKSVKKESIQFFRGHTEAHNHCVLFPSAHTNAVCVDQGYRVMWFGIKRDGFM